MQKNTHGYVFYSNRVLSCNLGLCIEYVKGLYILHMIEIMFSENFIQASRRFSNNFTPISNIFE